MTAHGRASTLTEHEWPALAGGVLNLADAHARHSLSAASIERVSQVVHALLAEGRADYFEAEAAFREALAGHTGQRYPGSRAHLTYSASIALDVVAKSLLPQRGPIGVITPTFDSVPALFARSGLTLRPIPESRLLPVCDLEFLSSLKLTALLVVAPNNPTGTVLAPDQMLGLLQWAARRGTTLILDCSFRMFDPGSRFDVIEAADGLGADAITVDDTGKTLPLHDTKVGVLSASNRLASRVRAICSDVLLTVSELNVRMLTALLEDDAGHGEVSRARRLAARNLAELRRLDPGLPAEPGPSEFQPSVAWLNWGPLRDDVIEYCRAHGAELLPGDRFHWDRATGEANPGAQWLRIPLLRDADVFDRGLRLLEAAATSTGGRAAAERRQAP